MKLAKAFPDSRMVLKQPLARTFQLPYSITGQNNDENSGNNNRKKKKEGASLHLFITVLDFFSGGGEEGAEFLVQELTIQLVSLRFHDHRASL